MSTDDEIREVYAREVAGDSTTGVGWSVLLQVCVACGTLMVCTDGETCRRCQSNGRYCRRSIYQ